MKTAKRFKNALLGARLASLVALVAMLAPSSATSGIGRRR